MVCAPSIPVIAPFEHPHARALTHLVMLTFPLWQDPPSDLPHGRLLRNWRCHLLRTCMSLQQSFNAAISIIVITDITNIIVNIASIIVIIKIISIVMTMSPSPVVCVSTTLIQCSCWVLALPPLQLQPMAIPVQHLLPSCSAASTATLQCNIYSHLAVQHLLPPCSAASTTTSSAAYTTTFSAASTATSRVQHLLPLPRVQHLLPPSGHWLKLGLTKLWK